MAPALLLDQDIWRFHRTYLPLTGFITEIMDAAYEEARKALSAALASGNIKQKLTGWDKQFQMKPTDGDPFYFVVKNGEILIEKGIAPNPAATIIMSSEDMSALLKKELNPVTALFTGKLKVDGSLSDAQALASLLS
ncbi:MAG: SCP2 sterol-binding domain-containing protein [Thermoprotei archaeon]